MHFWLVHAKGLFTSTILVFATIGSPLGVWISKKWGMRTVFLIPWL